MNHHTGGSRRLLIVERLLLVVAAVPTLLLVLSVSLSALVGEHLEVGRALLLALLFAAQVAAIIAIGKVVRAGETAVPTLSPWMSALFASNALLAGVGAAAWITDLALRTDLLGAFFLYLIAWPTMVPIVHLWIERRRAIATTAAPSRMGAVAAGTILAIAIAAGQWMLTGPLPFDRGRWDALSDQWDDPLFRRHRMADWLLATNQLQGRSRADVVARLGEPPDTGYFRDWSMVYQLGAERGDMGIDSEWLVMRMDEHDRVVEARLVRD